MKPLPKGNYALCIAHPGHELRLHGFLEQARPFVFILTDGSNRTSQDMMMDSIKTIDKAIKQELKNKFNPRDNSLNRIFCYQFPQNPDGQEHIKDSQIYFDILNQRTDFFISFIDFIAKNLIKYDVDYIVSDPGERTNACHEVMRILSDMAVMVVKKSTGKQISNYYFNIYKKSNEGINEECILVTLDDVAMERKLDAIIKYPFALTDLKPNISLDHNLIIELSKMKDGKVAMKQMIRDINNDFIKNEYLFPYVYSEPAEKPLYEINGEKAVASGKYFEVITHERHLKPLKQKLHQLILGNAN